MWIKRTEAPKIPDSFKSKEKPTTSFVIRTLNEGKWLPTVLTALFFQSRTDFEIIIVDSGSGDKTIEIAQKIPLVKLIQISKKEFGFSYALNIGIKNSKGKYIGILSGHSVPISKTWYEDGLKNLKNKKVAAVFGFYIALPDGHPTEKLGTIATKLTEKITHYTPWMSNTNALIRKSLWKQYPFDETLDRDGCEDYDWASEMLARGYDVIRDPKFDVHHSHGGIGRPLYKERIVHWKKTCALIDKKKRPSRSK